MDFEITPTDTAEGSHGLAVSGELDILAAPSLKERLTKLLDEDAVFVLVDLSETTFVDSTALGVLIGINRSLRLRDGALMIVCNPSIRTIFSLTLLDRVFDIFDTPDAAAAALKALEETRAADSVA
jgi:anti-sigma B factor antagonist